MHQHFALSCRQIKKPNKRPVLNKTLVYTGTIIGKTLFQFLLPGSTKRKENVGAGTLSCNMLSKYKVIVYISIFFTLKANAQYFFEKFRKVSGLKKP